jgi:hypothetical protein
MNAALVGLMTAKRGALMGRGAGCTVAPLPSLQTVLLHSCPSEAAVPVAFECRERFLVLHPLSVNDKAGAT